MNTFSRPKILVSKCIEFDHCRYDGSMISSKLVEDLKEYVDFIPVCAEMEIGFPSPRESLRLVGTEEDPHLVKSNSGEDYTDKMVSFAKDFLEKNTNDIDGAILKSKSPSCGIKEVKVYKSHGKAMSLGKKGKGIFGNVVLEYHSEIPIEDEARLSDFAIRENFLTKIFLIADYKETIKSKKMKDLIDFHSRNKYLLMMYNQSQLKILGSILGNHDKKNHEEVFSLYTDNLLKAIKRNPSYKTKINMLLHIFGYFSDELNSEEKAFFLDNLENYRNSKVPFSLPLSVLYSWAIRFNQEYLKRQRIFKSFPSALINVTDSGKGRER
ncbi:MAG: DUF1722 domain-containing protein [Clostridia bacterium]|nr:DUF1722 domain-containing protein [Clostridia bacterium]